MVCYTEKILLFFPHSLWHLHFRSSSQGRGRKESRRSSSSWFFRFLPSQPLPFPGSIPECAQHVLLVWQPRMHLSRGNNVTQKRTRLSLNNFVKVCASPGDQRSMKTHFIHVGHFCSPVSLVRSEVAWKDSLVLYIWLSHPNSPRWRRKLCLFWA